MTKTQVLLTEGSIPKKMLLFALPIFFSNLFQQLYNAADSLIVGNFIGKTALAAVGSSGNLIFLLVGFANGVAMGAGVLIARCFGAKDDASLERAVHTTVAVGLAGSAILTVLGVTLTPLILRWMGTPPPFWAAPSPISASIPRASPPSSSITWARPFCSPWATAAAPCAI